LARLLKRGVRHQMRGYWDIDRSTSHCVTFVEAEEVDEELSELVGRVRQNGFRIAYVDCSKFKECPWEILSEIGFQLKTDHPPYHADELRLVRWLDDLIALAYRTPGIVIVLDNAGEAFVESRRHMTELMEAFLVQVHHWLEQKVPCHLCFQMSPHPLVAKLFGGENGA
jgi:hypothetical protein